MTTDNTAALAAALAKVQAKLPKLERDRTVVVETKKGDPYSYSYVTLANLSDAILPLLAEHGLSFAAMPGAGSDGKMALRYHLLHDSGERLSGEFPISGEGGIQMIGGRITYARRYCLAALVGVAADEDDESRLADEAGRGTAQRAQQPRAAQQPAAGVPAARTAQRQTRPAAPPPALPGENGDGITQPQQALLHKLLNDLGRGDRAAGLAYISGVLRREVTTTKELTKADANQVIDQLQKDIENQEPPV